jgi:hypothetical protein
MTQMSKRSLISESVAAIRIDVHPVGKKYDQHIIHVAPWVSRMTTVCEVPIKSKSGPCFRDEVLAFNDRLALASS